MRIGLCLLFAGFAADAACAQDELPKEPISGTIQTWYKVTQKIGEKEQHVGYVEESISEAADRAKALFPYSFRYRMEAGLLTDSEITVNVGFYFEAQLNDQFETKTLSGRLSIENVEISFEYIDIDKDKVLRIAPDRRYELKKDEIVHFFLPLSTLQMRQQGLLSKTGKQTIKMFYPTEQGKNTAEVTLDVVRHSEVNKLEGEGRSKVSEIVVSGSPSTVKQLMQQYVKVDRYGRAIEITNDEGVSITIAKSREEAQGASKDSVQLHGRRDPFRKDLVMRKVEKGSGSKTLNPSTNTTTTDPNTNTTDPEQQPAALVKKVNELGDKVIELAGKKDWPAAEKAYADYLREYAAKKAAWKNNTKEQYYQDLLSGKLKVELVYKGAEKLVNQFVIGTEENPGYVGRIEAAAKNDDLPEMEKIYADMKKLSDRVEFDQAETAKKLFDDQAVICEGLIMTTKVRLEFLKIPFKLTATVIGFEDEPQTLDFEIHVLGHRMRLREELPFMKSTTYAVIRVDKKEGQYRKGDLIELDKDRSLKVVDITRYGATISWPAHEREIPGRSDKRKASIPEQLRELPLSREK